MEMESLIDKRDLNAALHIVQKAQTDDQPSERVAGHDSGHDGHWAVADATLESVLPCHDDEPSSSTAPPKPRLNLAGQELATVFKAWTSEANPGDTILQ